MGYSDNGETPKYVHDCSRCLGGHILPMLVKSCPRAVFFHHQTGNFV